MTKKLKKIKSYWQIVLAEVMGNTNSSYRFTNRKPKQKQTRATSKYLLEKYPLGEKFADAYFTRREAQCMKLLLRGKTIRKVAETLKLSARTVEFYLSNMKTKVGCNTKPELIALILESDFVNRAQNL